MYDFSLIAAAASQFGLVADELEVSWEIRPAGESPGTYRFYAVGEGWLQPMELDFPRGRLYPGDSWSPRLT